MKTVYFVRHGESESNVAKLVSGLGDDTPLTKNGKKQAKKVGKDLKDKGIELIVCSPLTRAMETARIIAKEIGYRPSKILRNPLFSEKMHGVYEGKPEKDYYADFNSGKLHPTVETAEQVYERVSQAVESLKRYEENVILVVSHRGPARVVRALEQNLDHVRMYELEIFGNAEVYKFNL